MLTEQERQKLHDLMERWKAAGIPLSTLFPDIPWQPNDFQEFGEDIETDHQCPKCGYRWS